MRNRLYVLAIAVLLVVVACGDSAGEIDVFDARVAQPTGPNAAFYFSATSNMEDSLIGAETDFSSSAQIHDNVIDDHGTMGMQPVESLDVVPGQTLVLEPGGLHLMLMDAERLEVGDEVEVILIWANTGEQTVTAEVVGPADAMDVGDDG